MAMLASVPRIQRCYHGSKAKDDKLSRTLTWDCKGHCGRCYHGSRYQNPTVTITARKPVTLRLPALAAQFTLRANGFP